MRVKHEKIIETRKIYCNQAQMAVYARNPEICKDCKGNSAIKSYSELREKTTANGVFYELEKVPYPVTPESVASYASSCDYRQDIQGAMAAAPRGQNLGDCTQMQNVLSLDAETAAKLYASLKVKFDKVPDKVPENGANSATAAADNVAPADNNNKEGK